jgi:hypothetical protein
MKVMSSTEFRRDRLQQALPWQHGSHACHPRARLADHRAANSRRCRRSTTMPRRAPANHNAPPCRTLGRRNKSEDGFETVASGAEQGLRTTLGGVACGWPSEGPPTFCSPTLPLPACRARSRFWLGRWRDGLGAPSGTARCSFLSPSPRPLACRRPRCGRRRRRLRGRGR